MSRKKKKPSAKRWRKASELAITIMKWTISTIAAVILGHYIQVLMNW